MKISSASKKVLASALSAAMVVAFAPTVAFAAPAVNDAGKIHFITATGANAAITDAGKTLKDVNFVLSNDDDMVTGDIDASNAAYYTYYGADIVGWGYDVNGDGKYTPSDKDSKDKAAEGTATSITSFVPDEDTFSNGGTINMVAIYDLATLGAVDTTILQKAAQTDAATAFSVATAGAKSADSAMKLTVKKGSDTLVNAQPLTIAKGAKGYVDVLLAAGKNADKAGTVDGTTAYIDAAKYGAGEYTFTIENAKGYTSTATAKIGTVTFTNGGDGSILINEGTEVSLLAEAGTNKTLTDDLVTEIKKVFAMTGAGKYNSETGAKDDDKYVWATADGVVVSNKTKVTGDLALSPVYGFVQKADTMALVGAQKKLTFGLNNTINIAAKTATEGVKSVAVSVQGPAGTILSMKKEAGDAAVDAFNADVALTFGSTANTADAWAAAAVTTQKLAAGTYTATYTVTDADGVSKTYSSSVELVTFTVVTGDEITPLTAAQLKTIPGLVAKGQTMDTAYYEDTKAHSFVLPGTKKTSTKTVKEWAVSGLTKVADGKALEKVDAGSDLLDITTDVYKVTGPVTVTAVYKDAKAALPAVSVSGTTVTLTAAEGTIAQYKTTGGWIDYTGPFTLAATDKTFYVAASKAGLETNPATYNRYDVYNGAQAKVKTFAVTLGQANTRVASNYAANDESYKAAVAAADAKIVAVGFATDWTAAMNEAKGDLVAALAATEKADLAKLNAGVLAENGTMSKISDAAYATACADLDKLVAAWAANTDKDDKNDVAVYGVDKTVDPVNYKLAAVKVADDAVAKKTVYKKADVDAAAAVSAQLKDPKTAAAGLEAFAALTSTQKELVSTADVAAAEAAVAQAKLVAAQDKAAAADGKAQVKGATYKIKAKGSKTIKIAKSASGAKVTLKQVSGTKYAKVSGTKVTLKKAAKKGKKYTIKVKAVCGATTTSTVSFKVLVK